MNDATEAMTTEEFHALLGAPTSERSQQKALVEWAGYKEGEIPALKLLLHVPNGGNRTARAGARMKAMGAKRGVLDKCFR